MYLKHLKIKEHPILKDLELNLINPKTKEPYSIIAFVGENGCGKTTLLNEIFNYDKSNYIIDKQTPYTLISKPFDALYLRQGSLHRNAMKEVRKLIDGKDMYPTNSATYTGGVNPFGLRSNNGANQIVKGAELLKQLGDKDILEIFESNHINEVYCSNDVSKLIDGVEHGYNISNYSSGQQEILLKLKDLRNMASGTDCVLLDEPETSLHPRWQTKIVSLIQMMLETDGMIPQIFIATHSEKVLESLITRKDTLIVRLVKKNGSIKTETINQMDLRLPKTTFAELDYVIFHINNMEYHDQLLNRFADIMKAETILDIDRAIKKHDLYDSKKYRKIWIGTTKDKVITYKTLPIYIRNYFHHPKEGAEPSDKEVKESILFLRRLIKKATF